MIYKLELPYTANYFEVSEKNTYKPYISGIFSKTMKYVGLIDKYHSWFIENNIWYDIERIQITKFEYDRSYLIFKNKADAALFKLTWLGI